MVVVKREVKKYCFRLPWRQGKQQATFLARADLHLHLSCGNPESSVPPRCTLSASLMSPISAQGNANEPQTRVLTGGGFLKEHHT